MSRFFNIKFIATVLMVVVLGEVFVLSQIYLDTHAETKREAHLVEQLLSEQAAQLRQQSDEDWQSSFALDNLSNLPNLWIRLIAEDGRILASNQTDTETETGLMSLLAWTLEKHVGLLTIMVPVVVDEQHVADIVIRENLDYELSQVATQAVELLLPWFFLFVISSFVLAHLFSVLLGTIDPLLSDKPGRQRHGMVAALLSLSCVRVPLRVLSSVFTLSQQFEQQKKKVVEVQEDERKRMAAELHDELGQHLTALRFELESLSEHRDSAQFHAMVDMLKQRSQRMSDIFRSNLEQLRPPELERYGLQRCLQQLVRDWQQSYPESELHYSFECHERLLSAQGQLVAYRVIQECLTNTRRHAGTDVNVSIRLYREADSVMIDVRDTGCGCDLTAVSGGFGLLGMRERVDALSGQLEIHSQPGHGMQVLAAIPLNVEL